MIDYKRRAIELAEKVNEYERTRNVLLRKVIFDLAKDLLRVAKLDKKTRDAYFAWVRNRDPKKAEKLFAEYLDLVRKSQV